VDERPEARGDRDDTDAPRPKTKRRYEPPRVLTDEGFEQISLACTSARKMTTKKNFT